MSLSWCQIGHPDKLLRLMDVSPAMYPETKVPIHSPVWAVFRSFDGCIENAGVENEGG